MFPAEQIVYLTFAFAVAFSNTAKLWPSCLFWYEGSTASDLNSFWESRFDMHLRPTDPHVVPMSKMLQQQLGILQKFNLY